MTRHLTRGLGLAAALTAAMSLAACVCGSQAGAGASAAGSASSGATVALPATGSDAAPPVAPEAMADSGEAGAVAAAEHFLRLSLHGAATGDWDEYDAMSVDECAFCKNYRDKNQENYEAGVRATISEVRIDKSAAWPSEQDPNRMRVDLLVYRGPFDEVDADGGLSRAEGKLSMMAFILAPADAGWLVAEVEALDESVFAELHGTGVK